MKRSTERICVVLGGGGHASVVIEALAASGAAKILAILDRNYNSISGDILGMPIVGDDSMLPELKRKGANSFVVGVGSIGDSRLRIRLFELGMSHQLDPVTVIHPAAICSPYARLGLGCQLFPGSIVNAGATLGNNVIVNSGAIVEHDCTVGDHAHIATGAKLCGMVNVAAGAHIGAGASVRQKLQIGSNAIVGVGAAVVADVPARVVVAGVPARMIKELA